MIAFDQLPTRVCVYGGKKILGKVLQIQIYGSWGGGPEKVTAHGDLSTVNPKISSIKQPSRITFEAR